MVQLHPPSATDNSTRKEQGLNLHYRTVRTSGNQTNSQHNRDVLLELYKYRRALIKNMILVLLCSTHRAFAILGAFVVSHINALIPKC